jgi:hypothetical protein
MPGRKPCSSPGWFAIVPKTYGLANWTGRSILTNRVLKNHDFATPSSVG